MSLSNFLSVILIGLGLSADCFAMALCGSVSVKNSRSLAALRMALAFGAAQALMPVLGWLIGRSLINLISGFDHWVVFGLLSAVGIRMLWEAFREKDADRKGTDITRGWLLITLAVVTSIDALAVGLSFSFLQINIIYACVIIGIVTFLVVLAGFYIGCKAGSLLGQRAKIIGGIILIGIGLRVLLNHLL